LIIESHPNPTESISDADQAISLDTLQSIVRNVKHPAYSQMTKE